MKTHVTFRSPSFPPYDNEEDEINPGLYGKRLAEFLVRGLTERGYQPQEPGSEDWGWYIDIPNPDFRLWIGCGHYEEWPDGFLCFIEPHRATVKKFLFFGNIDTTKCVGELQQALHEILTAEPTVTGIKWSTYDDFMRGYSGD